MKRSTIRTVWVILRYDGKHLTIQASYEDYERAANQLLLLSESIEATYWMQQMQVAV